mgnify:FL=1
MSYYKEDNKEKIALMAALYDSQQMCVELGERLSRLEKQLGTGPGVFVTRHWAKPHQDADGDWVLRKPNHLECQSVADAVGGCETVEEIVLPDDTPPE